MTAVAVAGASGVVGSRVLPLLLAREEVTRVVAVGRRALALEAPKLASKVVDLQSAPAIAAALPDGVDVAICSLGTTMKQAGSKEAFRKVDLDAVVAFATAARDRGARRFVLVSALDANAKAWSFYTRTKGEAEEALGKLGYPQLTIVRPALIDDQGTRPENRILERIGIPLTRAVFGKTHRYAPVPADTLARALVRLALDSATTSVRVVESNELHALGA